MIEPTSPYHAVASPPSLIALHFLIESYTYWSPKAHTSHLAAPPSLFALRVRKYAKFGVFYAKIVQMTPQRLRRESLRLQKFSVTNTVLSLPFLQQVQFMLIVNVVNLNYIIKIKELYCTTKQEGGKLWSKFTRWLPSWIWAFHVYTIVYTCQDHVLEGLKMAFFVVILDSKYSKMTPKFVKQKSQWLHSSIKFAKPGSSHYL